MNTATTLHERRTSPNLFFPIVLVGAGVIMLLTNLGILTRDPILFVLQFWPVFLIVGGIQLLFPRTGILSTVVSATLGLAVVGGALYYLSLPGETVTPLWWNWQFIR
jgi:hypothetical protein